MQFVILMQNAARARYVKIVFVSSVAEVTLLVHLMKLV